MAKRVQAQRAEDGTIDVGGMRMHVKALADLTPNPENPRVTLKPGDAGFEQLTKSLDRFGVVEPLVWNVRSGYLVSGHQRVEVLKSRGATEAPVSVVDLSPEDEKALGLVLNKASGEWDPAKLRDVLEGLTSPGLLETTGFTVVDLAQLNADLAQGVQHAQDLDDEPIFEPSLEPKVAKSNATAKSVKAADEAQGERFKNTREPKDVTCPHCGQVFGIGGWLQDYVEETEQLQAEAEKE